MANDFHPVQWDAAAEDDCRQLVRLAIREDLDRFYDLTTVALVAPEVESRAAVVARQGAVVAGLPVGPVILDEMQARLQWTPLCVDGQRVEAGDRVAQISGSARDLLVCERMLLNFLGRLSGVATTTRRFVEATAGAKAEIYDTRKTTPGWRLLEKYAVSQGGGRNHRRGLYDAVLIKDNHLALWRETEPDGSPAGAVLKAKAFVERAELPRGERPPGDRPPIEVEVDTLAQLVDVLAAGPDLVLLDNMSLDELRRAVALRDAAGDRPLLEASGGITLDRVGAVAATGVDRISVGGLTHSAVGVDFGLDWL